MQDSGTADLAAYCQLCHVHHHPFHLWPLSKVLHHHFLDADFTEVDVGDRFAAGVIPAMSVTP